MAHDTANLRVEPRPTLAPIEADFQTDAVNIEVKLCNLPPFPSVANQVLAVSADPDLDLLTIAKIIERDPAFAADILFLTNSSLFGFPSRMYVLRHAIAILGLERIKALAITVAMRAFVGKGGPMVRQCWRHSVACGLIAEEISAAFDFSGDRAYTAALMHDIGRLGLLKTYPYEMSPVLHVEHETVASILEAERAVLTVDHGRAGAWLVKNWALPLEFAHICEHHHDPLSAKDSGILALVKAACLLASIIGFPSVRCRTRGSYAEIAAALAPRLGKRALPPENELRTNVEERLRAFDH